MTAASVIRVVVAEDQGMVLGALVALLETETDILVVGRAHDGLEALSLLEAQRPDVLLTDIEMPRLSGIDVAAEVQRRRLATRVVIVTTFARAGYLRRALEAGAAGYLLKDNPPEVLADAVRRVHRGLRAIDPQLAAETWTAADPLTERERQALRLAADGQKSAEIAMLLGLSEGTVRNYLSDAMTKLGASTRLDAARIAQNQGWL